MDMPLPDGVILPVPSLFFDDGRIGGGCTELCIGGTAFSGDACNEVDDGTIGGGCIFCFDGTAGVGDAWNEVGDGIMEEDALS